MRSPAANEARGAPDVDQLGGEVDPEGNLNRQDVQAQRRDYILAELRCAHLRARLAQNDIEAIGLALKSRLMSPEVAAAALWNTDAVWYVGLDQPKGAA